MDKILFLLLEILADIVVVIVSLTFLICLFFDGVDNALIISTVIVLIIVGVIAVIVIADVVKNDEKHSNKKKEVNKKDKEKEDLINKYKYYNRTF